MKSLSENRSAGLALGGGAARGWAHIGVLRALAENNIRITHVAGTSIGAFVGAFFATNSLDTLMAGVLRLTRKQVLAYVASLPSRTGLLKGQHITAFLEEHLGSLTIEQCTVPLATVATDIRTGQEVTLARGNIVEAVRASIAVPGIFTPLRREAALLVDGGLVNPVPVSTVRTMGAGQVIAVDLNPVVRQNGLPLLTTEQPNMLEIIGASAQIIQASLTRTRLATDPPDLLICPDLAHISYQDFNRGEEIIELGYQAAMAALS